MGTRISLDSLRKEHARIKDGIKNGAIKVTHHGSASNFLKPQQEIN